jgi:hypothetical protein
MSVLDSSIDRIMNVINLAGGQNKNTQKLDPIEGGQPVSPFE